MSQGSPSILVAGQHGGPSVYLHPQNLRSQEHSKLAELLQERHLEMEAYIQELVRFAT